ncbi:MAG: glycoside hydrolase family 3 N-terminal domain-containing protein [Anaeromyxobacter sp.]
MLRRTLLRTLLAAGLASRAAVAQAEPDRCTTVPPAPSYRDWPRVTGPLQRDPAQEALIAKLVTGMTLAQKVGQMTQAEAAHCTPEEARRFYVGSILSGGNDWPAGRTAPPAGWLKVADAYWDASMSTDLPIHVPILYGVDAVHGNQKQFGATLFPHPIGLGATRDACLVERIGAATARQLRVSGLDYTFAPTVAVVEDVRWGRTYEGFSSEPAVVRHLSAALTRGLMGLSGPATSFPGVLTSSKHFLGDGGTDRGLDQGVNSASLQQLIDQHAQGYVATLEAGAQSVMASYSSWVGEPGLPGGKLHGSRYLLTTALKEKMGFDGFVISDYDAIAQLPGCTVTRCAQAINAGVDLFMVPKHWRMFIADTVDLVEKGEVPMSRIDDAVTRILRVKLRAGLFQLPRPSQRAGAGDEAALLARPLAREAVRRSLVLLKNEGGVLPLRRGAKVLVVGKGADSLPMQCGGWSLGWQSTDGTNADFPAGQTVLTAVREAVGPERVTFSEAAQGVDAAAFDAVLAVIGEPPYAEFMGDVAWNPLTRRPPPSGQAARETLELAARHPEDLAALDRVSGKGVPVVTVLLTGRPLYTDRELNRSAAFVVAWWPGTEGGGVADLLFRDAAGAVAHDFQGRLPFPWPRSACQVGTRSPGEPLFPLGYGLSYAKPGKVAALHETPGPASGCTD